jgi:hypothetical protein
MKNTITNSKNDHLFTLQISLVGILLFSNCQSEQVHISNREDLFKNCMETFEDEVKCSSFLKNRNKIC